MAYWVLIDNLLTHWYNIYPGNDVIRTFSVTLFNVLDFAMENAQNMMFEFD